MKIPAITKKQTYLDNILSNEKLIAILCCQSSTTGMQDKKNITIGINASFLRKPNTGIGQVTLNFLRKLDSVADKRINFILYLEEPLSKASGISRRFKKRVFLPPWKRDDLIRKTWWEGRMLPKYAKKDKCDAFISLYQCPTVLPSGVKHIMVVHDLIPKIFSEYLNNSRKKIYESLTEKAILEADRIIAVSKRTERDLLKHLGISGEKVTASYIDVDEIYKKKIISSRKQKVLKKYKLKPGYILAGGGMEVRKNVEGVIRAYKNLLEKNKNLHFVNELPPLVVYGKLLPELKPLITDAEKLAKELNLTQHVKLLGVVLQEDLPALFSEAKMFVYPSHYEGFGMPVLEAMSVGTPVITSKSSSLPEVGGDSVVYCKANDIRDIAMVMKNVLINKELREELSQKGKTQSKKFSWEKFVKKVLAVLGEAK
jgi:glycosyltransferase involved in cell wall biosynthesis